MSFHIVATSKGNAINGFNCAASEHPGYKSPTEDRYTILPIGASGLLVCVFDGHAGSQCSEFINAKLPNAIKERIEHENVLQNTSKLSDVLHEEFLRVNRAFLQTRQKSGSTGTVVIVTPTHYVFAHVGDSPAVLYDNSTHQVKFATTDHDCENPMERARVLDGCQPFISPVSWPKNIRIAGNLAVSRAFGDAFFIEHGIIANPQIKVLEREANETLVVCCDSFTETILPHPVTALISIRNALTRQELVDNIYKDLSNENLQEGVKNAVQNRVERYFYSAGKFYNGDNTTLVAVRFDDENPEPVVYNRNKRNYAENPGPLRRTRTMVKKTRKNRTRKSKI